MELILLSDGAFSPGDVVDVRFQFIGFVGSSKGPADITS